MNQFSRFIRRIYNRVYNNDFFKSLSKSFLVCLPLFIIGSFSLLLTSFPIPQYTEFLSNLLDGKVRLILEYVTRGTFDVISIALVISTCFYYAYTKKLTTISMFSMVVAGTCSYLTLVYEPLSNNGFGITNLFTSIIVCAISCNLYLFITTLSEKRNKKIIGNTDYMFQLIVESILPTVIIILLAALTKVILIVIFKTSDINAIIAMPLQYLFTIIKHNFISGFVYVFLVHLLWSFGIHGGNVLESIVADNFLISTNGGAIFSKTFNDVFVLMGGSGAILALIIAILIFSKQKSTKKIGYVSLITVPFNINELVIFGLPIVFNPTFIIPFILTPIFCLVSSYLAIALNIVPVPQTEVNWTTPLFFSGYLATGSISGLFLQLFNLIAGVFIYMPFVKKYDRVIEKRTINSIRELENSLFSALDLGLTPNLLRSSANLSGVARLLIFEIEEAIKNDQFEMYYQGQFDNKGVCYGAEALLRYKYNKKVPIAPPLIIELAKEGGIIYELEKYLFTKIVNDIKKNEMNDLIISFNVTIPTLMNQSFEQDFLTIINYDKSLANKINIELTEESTFANEDNIISKIHRLSERGFIFSIDDFGMGHTSLLYLQANCFKELKLDGSLVKKLLSEETNEKIIASIVYLSETIKFSIVAEYVETIEEIEKLKSIGVSYYQGYYFAKPMPYNLFVQALSTSSFWKNE